MWIFIYFLITVIILFFILSLDVRIKGKNYETDWEEMPFKIGASIFWPLLIAALILMGIFFPIIWIINYEKTTK